MKVWGWLLIGALVGGLIYGEIRAARARAGERTAAREQELRLKMAWADSVERVRREADSAARVAAAVWQRRSAHLVNTAAASQRRADSLLSRVPDTALAETIRAEYDTALQALAAAVHVSEARAALFYARWQAADTALARERALRDSWRQQATYWRTRSQRRFACVAGPGLAAGFGGAAGGISVTCGIKL